MLNFIPIPPLITILFRWQFSAGERCVYAFLTALIFGLYISGPMIKHLSNLGCGQVFRTRQQVRDLAILHSTKAGTPTMGGIIILVAILASCLIWISFNNFVLVALIVYFLCSALGLADDLLKINKGNSDGVRSWQKLFFQALITWFIIHIATKYPQIGGLVLDVKWQWFHKLFSPEFAFIILCTFYFFVLAGTTNSVNLTDGLDGLAITCLFSCFAFFTVVSLLSCDFNVIQNSLLSYISGAGELSVLCACASGGCLAFCAVNIYPAAVFMGDVGSMGLGGLLAIIAILLRLPFILLVVGAIFVAESLSVMLQMSSKRFFKKKIFLMSPVHHHFELKGYSERNIVKVVFCIQLLCILLGLKIVFYGYI